MDTDTSDRVELRCGFCLEMNELSLASAGEKPRCTSCERPFLLDRPVKVEEDDFAATVEGARVPVLVDFHADWCGPCKMIAPIMDNIAHENQGRVIVAKVDVDRAQGVAGRLKIGSIPTLILFMDGEERGRSVGFEPDRIRRMVEFATGKGDGS